MSDLDEDEMLEYCSCQCTGSIVDFVDDLIEYKKKFGALTERQQESLEKIYYVQKSKEEK